MAFPRVAGSIIEYMHPLIIFTRELAGYEILYSMGDIVRSGSLEELGSFYTGFGRISANRGKSMENTDLDTLELQIGHMEIPFGHVHHIAS